MHSSVKLHHKTVLIASYDLKFGPDSSSQIQSIRDGCSCLFVESELFHHYAFSIACLLVNGPHHFSQYRRIRHIVYSTILPGNQSFSRFDSSSMNKWKSVNAGHLFAIESKSLAIESDMPVSRCSSALLHCWDGMNCSLHTKQINQCRCLKLLSQRQGL